MNFMTSVDRHACITREKARYLIESAGRSNNIQNVTNKETQNEI